MVLPVGKLHLVRETISKIESAEQTEKIIREVTRHQTLDWRTIIVELFNLCAKYVVLDVDDFSIGYTLNFVFQLCGYGFHSS